MNREKSHYTPEAWGLGKFLAILISFFYRFDPMTLVDRKQQFGSDVIAIYWSTHGEVFRDLNCSEMHFDLEHMNWMRDQAAKQFM
jgi:hypothetical protein